MSYDGWYKILLSVLSEFKYRKYTDAQRVQYIYIYMKTNILKGNITLSWWCNKIDRYAIVAVYSNNNK